MIRGSSWIFPLIRLQLRSSRLGQYSSSCGGRDKVKLGVQRASENVDFGGVSGTLQATLYESILLSGRVISDSNVLVSIRARLVVLEGRVSERGAVGAYHEVRDPELGF